MRKITAIKVRARHASVGAAIVSRALLCSALLSGGVLPLQGCAQSVGDIDRTQPDLVPKSAFDGQWFIRSSVIDVPTTSTVSFIGEMHEMEVVTWEIQEGYLVGYRAYEKVPGSEAQAERNSAVNAQEVAEGLGDGRDKSQFKGNPIVAYEISDHVDVQREYNATTGEQTNVVTENSSDRPWHERNFMRVDWSSNEVNNLLHKPDFMFATSGRREFIPESEGGADAFKMDFDEEGNVNYIDFTERHFVKPTLFGCLGALYSNGIGDCTDDEVKVRTSMLKVDVQREQDYEPVAYDDRRHGEFGYFRTERPSYDRGRGNVFSGLRQYANRHEIWASNRDKQGVLKPHADRKLRAITYTLSPNYPADLIEVTEEMAAEYDAVLKRVAATARGQDEEALVTDIRKHTGGTCLFCLDTNENGEARIGDLRRNFIYWVEDPQQLGPLGYGPSSAHPETGRIVSAAAYVYGAGIDRYATSSKDMVDALNGKLEQDDLLGFKYIKDAVRSGLRGADSRTAKELGAIPLDQVSEKLLGSKAVNQLAQFRKLGPNTVLDQRSPGLAESYLRRIQGTRLENLMLPEELERDFDPNHLFAQQLGDQLTLIPDTNIPSMVHWATEDGIRKLNEFKTFAGRHNLWLEDFGDPAIIGLAREKAQENLSDEELLRSLRRDIYRAVMLHELGHTVGLRHNFAGSGDPLNYHDDYWKLRKTTLPQEMLGKQEAPTTINRYLRGNCSMIDSVNEEACERQSAARMSEFQYSSIMDYGGRFNSDFHGLGYYDRAAIASAYGDLVEVFDDDVSNGLSANYREFVQAANTSLSPVLDQGLPAFGDIHYTDLPEILGGVDNLRKRKWVPRAEWDNTAASGPVRVPYMACYDEFVDAIETCHRWDQGADNFEITTDYIQRYKEYYLFNNFQRDRVGFSGVEVLNRVASRYLLPITNMYQHWFFSSFYTDPDRPQAILGAIATDEGFNTLWNIMATPNYGAYVYNADQNELQQTTYDYETQNDADLRIEPGVGRRPFSKYDFAAGYDPFSRVLESGHFYDQWAALIALSSSNASVIGGGANAVGDGLRYSIPYYLRYSQQLNQLFGALFQGSYGQYAPRLVGGKVVGERLVGGTLVQRSVLNPTRFTPEQMDEGVVVRVAPTYFTRINALVTAAGAFRSNFETEFLYRMQIRMKGSGEERVVADDFDVVEARNPNTGAVYVAYRPQDPERQGESWLGAELVVTLAEMVEEWEAATDAGEKANMLQNIQYHVRDIELAREAFDIFGLR